MNCLKRREGDEWSCIKCRARWGVDDATPEHAECYTGRPELNDQQVACRLGVMLANPYTLERDERADVVRSLQVACGDAPGDLRKANNHALRHFPYLKHLLR